jgi:glycosyltransferase involved in cell wall biosynthesis
MRIGIDARMYGSNHSGLGRYVEQLVLHLGAVHDEHEFVVFVSADAFESFTPPHIQWKKVLADVPWYGVREQVELPRLFRKEHVDLMHFPHWNVPVLYRGPFVLTIHDLIMFHFSRKEATTHSPLVYAIKDRVHRMLVRSSARRARHIIATSEFTKQDIVDTLGVAPQKISVTYQAPFQRVHESTHNTRSVLDTYNVTKPYILYVGNAYPHKNLEQLTDAWGIFSKEYPEYQLVLVGKQSVFYKRVEHHVLRAGYTNIVCTGFVPDDALNELYDHAMLYVFPSLYEGFGLPPLEAMTHRVPVISSSASCMPEVLGLGALYFDPENVSDIVRALTEGTQNEDIRYTLRQNAKEELKRYSWEHLARQTREIYRRA